MSRKSEEEIQAIMEEYRDAPMVNPDKVYPPLPPVQNVTPLVRVPEQMSFTEKIGGTEYTVDAHFRKDERHREFSEVWDETLNRRALKLPKSIEEQMIEAERAELLCKAVDRLPEIQRRRFLLYYEYEFNFYQIAAMEHCTASAIQKSVAVAKKKVKAEMRKYLQP